MLATVMNLVLFYRSFMWNVSAIQVASKLTRMPTEGMHSLTELLYDYSISRLLNTVVKTNFQILKSFFF